MNKLNKLLNLVRESDPITTKKEKSYNGVNYQFIQYNDGTLIMFISSLDWNGGEFSIEVSSEKEADSEAKRLIDKYK